MPLNIGSKVYRNMQEQVAYLTELVDELKQIIKDKEYSIKEIEIVDGHLIFELADGTSIDAGEVISITGVEINASSHLVITYNDGTSEDLGLIKSITSVTKNASGHVIVTYSDGSTADVGLLKGISSCSLDANKHLIINYDNGTSEDVGAVLSGEYDLTGLDVIAKTFRQTNPNYNYNITWYPSYSLSIDSSYSKVNVINRTLNIIVNVIITNNTGSAVNVGSGGVLFEGYSDYIASQIAANIIDFDGNTLGNANNYVAITFCHAFMKTDKGRSGTYEDLQCLLYNYDSGRIMFRVLTQEAITIPDGQTRYICCRLSLFV